MLERGKAMVARGGYRVSGVGGAGLKRREWMFLPFHVDEISR